jgi:hypothetical protein
MSRKIGDFFQGVDERIVYSVTTTAWGSNPTSVVVTAYAYNGTYTDVSDTVLVGSPLVEGDVITLPELSGLTLDMIYRIEVKFTSEGNVFEPWFQVTAER